MLDSISIGMAGLAGFSKGIKVIGNNTSNMNTPGFKGARLQFGNMVFAGSQSLTADASRYGAGINTYSTSLNFEAGDLRQTGANLDLAIDGLGLFVLKNLAGETRYTRAGQFEFDAKGVLVNRNDKSAVQGLDADGRPGGIDLSGLRVSAPRASSNVAFKGNLSSSATDQTVSNVNVLDAAGGNHALSLKLTSESPAKPGSWLVSVLDGSTEVGTGTILFKDGLPVAGSSEIKINYKPIGQAEMPLTLSFGTEVTSYATGNLSTLAFASQNGFQAGSLSKVRFDAAGLLSIEYSNGQTAKGKRLALARFDSDEALEASGDNQFQASGSAEAQLGPAQTGGFGTLRPGYIEFSNVDLSKEFGELVIMQRGYQASSQIVSTANEMIEQLFAMRGK